MIVAGVVVLVFFLVLGRAYVTADPKDIVRLARRVGAIVLGLLAGVLLLRGVILGAVFVGFLAWFVFRGARILPSRWFPSRDPAEPRAAPAAKPSTGMTRAEALQVLGLREGASAEDIHAAHHRLIGQNHPDHGGTTYLASKINEARDVLLGA